MLLRALLDEMALERREPIFPVLPILIREVRDVSHRFGPQRDAMLAPDYRPANKPCSLQHANVLRYRVERHVERLRKLRDSRLTFLQPCEHGAPCGVPKCGEHSAQRRIAIINHEVEY